MPNSDEEQDQDLPPLARAFTNAIRGYECLPKTTPTEAGRRLLFAAAAHFYALGYGEADYNQIGYIVRKAYEADLLGE